MGCPGANPAKPRILNWASSWADDRTQGHRWRTATVFPGKLSRQLQTSSQTVSATQGTYRVSNHCDRLSNRPPGRTDTIPCVRCIIGMHKLPRYPRPAISRLVPIIYQQHSRSGLPWCKSCQASYPKSGVRQGGRQNMQGHRRRKATILPGNSSRRLQQLPKPFREHMAPIVYPTTNL